MALIGRGQVKRSHRRLSHTLSGLTDADARRPSLLPGWTVAHVLSHLARNADSHVRLLEAAARGEVADQYAGGNAQRAHDIEVGAGRAAADLVDDVVTSALRLEEVWEATTEEVWRSGHGRVVSGIWPVAELPFRRWREVELHHVDLGLGYGVCDWPDSYVDMELARSLSGLPSRLAEGVAVDLRATDSGERWVVPAGSVRATPVAGDRQVLLAWLVGRGEGDGFPILAPWAG